MDDAELTVVDDDLWIFEERQQKLPCSLYWFHQQSTVLSVLSKESQKIEVDLKYNVDEEENKDWRIDLASGDDKRWWRQHEEVMMRGE